MYEIELEFNCCPDRSVPSYPKTVTLDKDPKTIKSVFLKNIEDIIRNNFWYYKIQVVDFQIGKFKELKFNDKFLLKKELEISKKEFKEGDWLRWDTCNGEYYYFVVGILNWEEEGTPRYFHHFLTLEEIWDVEIFNLPIEGHLTSPIPIVREQAKKLIKNF